MQRRRRTLLTVVSAALGVAALAMPAESLAEPVPVWARYTITVQGRAVFDATKRPDGTRNAEVHARFSYSGAVSYVTFRSSSGFRSAPLGTTKISQASLNLIEWDTAPHANPAEPGQVRGSYG